MMYVFNISYPHEGAIHSLTKKRDCKTLDEAHDYFSELLEQYPPGAWFYLCNFGEEYLME